MSLYICYTDKKAGAAILRRASTALSVALLASCSTTGMREKADAEVYAVLEEKGSAVPGALPGFSVEPTTGGLDLSSFAVTEHTDASLGTGVAPEDGSIIVDLDQALVLATQRNRAYQSAKESLYLQALELTLDRHRYTPIFSGGLSSVLEGSAVDKDAGSDFNAVMTGAGAVIEQIEQVTGTQAELLRAYADVVKEAGAAAELDQSRTRLVGERAVSGRTRLGADLLMRGGARIAATLTTNFLRFLTGDPREQADTALNMTLTQPLLRGAGREIAAEQLTQSERDTLYALRDYTHYRKDFTVEICSAYYNVLQQRDIVRNTWSGLQNFRASVERERAFAEEGLRTQAELGRMVQAQLDNENRYINAVRRYQEELDGFKIQLGLSTDTRLVLDDHSMDVLRAAGLNHPEVSAEDAVAVALSARLDYYNALDQVEDAERGVRIAANALKPGVDFVADALVSSKGENSPERLDFNRMTWNVGLEVDPLFDRKAERNAFRAALIYLERAKRQASQAEDAIKFDVRAAWRNLEQARRNYEVAQESVRLSERRVEEQKLLAELGQATAQDQVDAQNDLIQAQNDLTSALIAHTLARLGFWRDMGILYIDEQGVWREGDATMSGTASEGVSGSL